MVTHSSKNAIENHFDTSYELEATLEKRVKRALLKEVRSICPADVTIMGVRQGDAKGLDVKTSYSAKPPTVQMHHPYCTPSSKQQKPMAWFRSTI